MASRAAPAETSTCHELVNATTRASARDDPARATTGNHGTARSLRLANTRGRFPSRAVAYMNLDAVTNPPLNVLIAVIIVTASITPSPNLPATCRPRNSWG